MTIRRMVPGETRVGWVGTGVMGASMCGHLIDKGFSATVYNRTRSKAEPLLAKGAAWAGSPKEVAEQSDVVFTIAEQKEAFNAYLAQSPYATSRVGNYTERNGVILPWLNQIDLGIQQDFAIKSGKTTQRFQLRLDLYNAGNLLNNAWGIADRLVLTAPLTYNIKNQTYNYTMTNNELRTESYDKDASLNSVWQMQVGVRYFFN